MENCSYLIASRIPPDQVLIFCIKVKVSPAFLLLRGPGAAAGVLGAIWVAFGASWGSLGASWEGLGGLLGRCWGLLARSWDLLGRSWGLCWYKSIFKTNQDRFYDDFGVQKGCHEGDKMQPKTIQNRSKNRQQKNNCGNTPPKDHPMRPQERPKRPQDPPKRPPRPSQEAPKRLQEAPKTARDSSK